MTDRAGAGTAGVAGARINAVSIVATAFLFAYAGALVALFAADILYIDIGVFGEVLRSPAIRAALRLSVITSVATLFLVVLFAVPAGYALSRYRFRGKTLVDTLVDLPIVLPTIIIGISLLVFFRTPIRRLIEGTGLRFVYAVPGIVLCQFLASASYGIRAAKAAFDSVDVRLEELALTLGCTRARAFFAVTLPLARNGITAGAIMAWAHAVGIFGPLMVFAGAVRMKTEVLPTTIYLELSIGRIEVAIAVAMLMLLLAAAALVLLRLLAGSRRRWGA